MVGQRWNDELFSFERLPGTKDPDSSMLLVNTETSQGDVKHFASFLFCWCQARAHPLVQGNEKVTSCSQSPLSTGQRIFLSSFSQKLLEKLLSAGSGWSGSAWKRLNKFKLLASCPQRGCRLRVPGSAEPVSTSLSGLNRLGPACYPVLMRSASLKKVLSPLTHISSRMDREGRKSWL